MIRWIVLIIIESTLIDHPPGQAESHPDVSGSGFIDESPYTGPGTQLQSQQNRFDIRVAGVMERFGKLNTEIYEWEMLLNSQVISPNVINRQINHYPEYYKIWPEKLSYQ